MAKRGNLSVDEANGLLKQAGLRKTYTRISILQCLGEQSAPVTHAEISQHLAPLGFDASTVYRGLSALVDAAIVTRLDLGDHTWRFEMREEPPEDSGLFLQHPHVVCRICGRIDCLDLQAHVAEYDGMKGWLVEEILYKGICRACSKKNANR